jgi:hypothetical protein
VRGSGTSCQWFSCKSVKTARRQYTRENQFNISRWRDHEVITLVAVRRPVRALYYICDVWIVLWEGNAPSGVATTCEHLAAASGIDTSISLWSFGRNSHHSSLQSILRGFHQIQFRIPSFQFLSAGKCSYRSCGDTGDLLYHGPAFDASWRPGRRNLFSTTAVRTSGLGS